MYYCNKVYRKTLKLSTIKIKFKKLKNNEYKSLIMYCTYNGCIPTLPVDYIQYRFRENSGFVYLTTEIW